MDKRGLTGYSSWGRKESGVTEYAHRYYTLVVQWLRLHTPNAGGLGLMPGQGTKISHCCVAEKRRKLFSNCLVLKKSYSHIFNSGIL